MGGLLAGWLVAALLSACGGVEGPRSLCLWLPPAPAVPPSIALLPLPPLQNFKQLTAQMFCKKVDPSKDRLAQWPGERLLLRAPLCGRRAARRRRAPPLSWPRPAGPNQRPSLLPLLPCLQSG